MTRRQELKMRKISIHALREEGDRYLRRRCAGASAISIHALREEGDHAYKDYAGIISKFLSTPSARRATSAKADTGLRLL